MYCSRKPTPASLGMGYSTTPNHFLTRDRHCLLMSHANKGGIEGRKLSTDTSPLPTLTVTGENSELRAYGGSPGSQNMAYDLNGDGKISTADIQMIINEMKK